MHKRISITLDEGYKAMAQDEECEAEVLEWCNSPQGRSLWRFPTRLMTLKITLSVWRLLNGSARAKKPSIQNQKRGANLAWRTENTGTSLR